VNAVLTSENNERISEIKSVEAARCRVNNRY